MDFTQELTLDLNAGIAYTTIAVKQGDSARWLKIHLTKNNIPYPLDVSHNFMFRMRKPDGHGVINPAFVELASSNTYVPIEVTEENYNDRDYYHKESNIYNKVSQAYFFQNVTQPEEGKQYYHINDDGTFSPVEPGWVGPLYEFVEKTDIYYLLDNINYEESTINIQLTEQVLAIAGRAYADIVEYNSVNDVLSTASFIINIIAQPNVATNAVSTDEFQELVHVVTEADDILGEAETWARGTKKNNEVTIPSYLIDDNVNASNFDHKKNGLYIQTGNSFIPVESGAAYSSNNTYYYKDASSTNNAKYYSENALNAWSSLYNLAVTAEELETGVPAYVTKINNSDPLTFKFGLPKGATGAVGPRGPVNCVVSSEAPTDSDIVIWLNTAGSLTPYIGNANQITYDTNIIYDSNTVGYAIQGIGIAEQAAVTAQNSAVAAASAAQKAQASASAAIDVVNTVQSNLVLEINNRQTADSGLLSEINKKITNPTINVDFNKGLLMAEKADDSSGIIDYSWAWPLSFNDLGNRPRINNHILESDDNLALIAKDNHQVGINDLNSNLTQVYNLAESAVQLLEVNNSALVPSSYIAPYIVDLQVTESNWASVRSSLYIYDNDLNDYKQIENDTAYNPNIYYYTHDSSYDGYQCIKIGTVLTEENVVNKNYLDNSWFTVNQHKFTSATVSDSNIGDYLCDRWKVLTCQNQSRTIELSNSGLQISAGDTDALNDFAIGQVLDKDLGTSLIGKTVCLSVGYYDGIKVSYSSGFAVCQTTGTPFIQIKEGRAWFIRLTKQGDNLVFQIACGQNLSGAQLTDDGITIKNVKLEIGNFSTLPQDVAPAYPEELAKCQKYFYRCEGQAYNSTFDNVTIVGRGIASLQKQLDWTLELPYVMTSRDAIITTSTDLIARKGILSTASVGNLSVNDIALSTIFNGTNGIYLQTTSNTNMTQFASYYVLLPMATESGEINYITISDEL